MADLTIRCPKCRGRDWSNEDNHPYNYKCVGCGWYAYWTGEVGFYWDIQGSLREFRRKHPDVRLLREVILDEAKF